MLVTISKTHKTEETVELKLPTFFKKGEGQFIMVSNDGDVIEIFVGMDFRYASMMVHKNNQREISMAIEYDQCSPTEFFSAFDKVMAYLETDVFKPSIQ